MPVLSIIITVFNLENYIEECLKSVIDQEFKDYEIVLVDNVSTDRSREICEAYARKYSHINYIKLEGESIIGRAHRVGIIEAKGEYIHILDGDDFVSKGCYSDIIKIIKEKTPDVIMGGFKCYPENGAKNVRDANICAEKINKSTYSNALKYIMNLPNFHMVQWRYIYNKSIFMMANDTKKLFYSKEIPSNYYGDVYTTTRILVKAKSIYYYEKPFYCYRTRAKNGITSQVTEGHYFDLFYTFWILLPLAESYKGIRREYIYSRITLLFKLFSSGVDVLSYESITQMTKMVESGPNLLSMLNKINHSEIKKICDFIRNFGIFEGIYIYCAYRKAKLLSQMESIKGENIYIFPSGNEGESVARILMDSGFNVCGFLDNDTRKNNTMIAGIKCQRPDDLRLLDKCENRNIYVIISTIYDELKPVLKEQLLKLGIPMENIAIKE